MTTDISESFEFHSFRVKEEGQKAKWFLISDKSSVVSITGQVEESHNETSR